MTKKILFISPTNTLDNGAEISIFYLMSLLVNKGYQVYNVTQQGYPEAIILQQKRYKSIGVTNFYLNSSKWWWEDAPGGQPASSPELAMSYRDNIQQIKSIIEEQEIDLVISNTVNVFQGAVAAALAERPHYWIIHEFPENEFSYYREKCDFISEYSDEIFTVAGSLEKNLEKHFPTKQLKTFLPFNQLESKTLRHGKNTRFVSIGRLTERKNQLELVKAYHLLSQKIDNLPELIFIGGADEDYLKKMKTYIKHNNLNRISFMGHVDSPWSLVTDKDVAVFPSKMETFGMVYVESLWHGIPTIISNNPGHQTVYNLFKVGSLYPVGDIEALAQKMQNKLSQFAEFAQQATEDKKIVNDLYQLDRVYGEFLSSIDQVSARNSQSSLRHLDSLLTLNQPSTRLVKGAMKLSRLLQKLKHKFN